MNVSFAIFVLQVLFHCVITILKLLLYFPLKVWFLSAKKLFEQNDKKRIECVKTDDMWPFLTFLKRYIFDFLFDAAIFLSYFIGIVVCIVIISYDEEFFYVLIAFIVTYYMPYMILLLRDILNIMLIPFYKFVNWGSKPAQYIEIKNK